MSSTDLIKSKSWPALALLCLLAWLAYGNSFPGAFHFDDFELMLENPWVSGRSFDFNLFLNHYGGRPLTLWTFHLNYNWGGTDPAGYHVVNLMLHLLAACLLFQTAVSYGLEPDVSLLGAAIFMVHPLQTQAVNYIWSRSLLLMSVWILISLLTVRRNSPIGLGAFQLAIWSRAEALVLAPVLLAQKRRHGLFVAALVLLNLAGLWWGIHQEKPPEFGLNYSGAAAYWWAQPWTLLRYVSWFLWPSGLSIDHDSSEVGSLGIVLPAIIFLTSVLVFRFFDSRSGPGGGLLVSLAALVLLPSALLANPDILNESRPYLAMAALSLVAAAVLLRLAGKKPVRKAIVGLAIVLPLILLTRVRNETWRSDVALWEDAVEKAPGKSRAHYNLGVALAKAEQPGRARGAFQQASRLNPFDDLSYAGLGFCAELQGRKDLAHSYYQQAVELAPSNDYAQEALARIVASSDQNGPFVTNEDDPKQ